HIERVREGPLFNLNRKGRTCREDRRTVCQLPQRRGNSERLAKALVEGLDADSIFLTDYRIEPIIDYRHTEPGPYPEDDYRKLLDRVLKQDLLIFATPIY